MNIERSGWRSILLLQFDTRYKLLIIISIVTTVTYAEIGTVNIIFNNADEDSNATGECYIKSYLICEFLI